MAATDPFSLPRGWTKTTRSSVLHAISLAFTALTRAWSSSATSPRRTTRLQADLDRAKTEIAPLATLQHTLLIPSYPNRRPARSTRWVHVLRASTIGG